MSVVVAPTIKQITTPTYTITNENYAVYELLSNQIMTITISQVVVPGYKFIVLNNTEKTNNIVFATNNQSWTITPLEKRFFHYIGGGSFETYIVSSAVDFDSIVTAITNTKMKINMTAITSATTPKTYHLQYSNATDIYLSAIMSDTTSINGTYSEYLFGNGSSTSVTLELSNPANKKIKAFRTIDGAANYSIAVPKYQSILTASTFGITSDADYWYVNLSYSTSDPYCPCATFYYTIPDTIYIETTQIIPPTP
jgi:hypothetical protein